MRGSGSPPAATAHTCAPPGSPARLLFLPPALLDDAAALNLTVLRVFATGTEPELPLMLNEGGRVGGTRPAQHSAAPPGPGRLRRHPRAAASARPPRAH